jgi:antitoxin (DNA-binding transcriptional repressor) of toxin-antitoxin stability system
MKLVEKADATDTLAEYAANIQGDPIIVTDQGCPVAALVSLENADLETVSLSTNQHFLALIERSRARIHAEGGISSQEMRRRFEQTPTSGSE